MGPEHWRIQDEINESLADMNKSYSVRSIENIVMIIEVSGISHPNADTMNNIAMHIGRTVIAKGTQFKVVDSEQGMMSQVLTGACSLR